MKIYIYQLLCPDSLQIRYIGKTKYPKYRLSSHLTTARKHKGNRHVCSWIKSLLLNKKLPIFNIIEECTEENWEEREIYWIAYFKKLGCNLTNHRKGGRGSHNNLTTEEAKNKRREGLLNYWKDREHPCKNTIRPNLSGENRYNAKLTNNDVLEIKSLLQNGTKITEIAEKFNVNRITINDIKLGKTWKHLGDFKLKGPVTKKYNDSIIELIIKDRKSGITLKAISSKYDLSTSMIQRILNGTIKTKSNE